MSDTTINGITYQDLGRADSAFGNGSGGNSQNSGALQVGQFQGAPPVPVKVPRYTTTGPGGPGGSNPTPPLPAPTYTPPDYNDIYSSYLNANENVRSQMETNFQQEIDALNKKYADLNTAQNATNQQNLGMTEAEQGAEGNIGSTAGSSAISAQKQTNIQNSQQLADQQASETATLTEQNITDQLNLNATQYKTATDQATATQALLGQMAASGTSLDSLSPQNLNQLFQASGIGNYQEFKDVYDGLQKAALAGSKPFSIGANGSAYFNPATGQYTMINTDQSGNTTTSATSDPSQVVALMIDPTGQLNPADITLGDAINQYPDTIVQAFIQQEGGSPQGVQNNPGNIKFAGLPGQTDSGVQATDGGTYASYATPQDGVAAVSNLLNGYDQTQTLQQAIWSYKGYTPPAPSAIGTTGSPQINSSANGYSTMALDDAGGLTQAAIDQAALAYAMSGTLPTGARASTGKGLAESNAIKNRAAELNANGNVSSNKAKLSTLTSTLGTQTDYLNTMQRSVNTVDDNLQILQGLATKVNQSSSPIVNQLNNMVTAGIIGSGDLAAFKSSIQTVRTEYSNILARGGTVTDSVRGEAAQLIPDNITLDQLNQVLGVLSSEGQNVIQEATGQVNSINDQINDIVGGGNLYANQTSTTQSNLPQDVQSTIQSNLTFSPDGKTAYLPRSVWSTLGSNMDAVLAEAKAEGFNLLING